MLLAAHTGIIASPDTWKITLEFLLRGTSAPGTGSTGPGDGASSQSSGAEIPATGAEARPLIPLALLFAAGLGWQALRARSRPTATAGRAVSGSADRRR